MKRIQESAAGKAIAIFLLLTLTFVGTGLCLKAIMAVPYLDTEDYTQTGEFYDMLRERENDLAGCYAETDALDSFEMPYAERRQREAELERLTESLKPENTSFRYRVYLPDGTEVATNIQAGEEVVGVRYATFTLGEHSMMDMEYGANYTQGPTAAVTGDKTVYSTACGVLAESDLMDSGIADEFTQLSQRYHLYKTNFSDWLSLGVGLLIAAALCVLYILWTAGHKAGEEGIVLTWQEHIFFDLYLAAMSVPAVSGFCGGYYFAEHVYIWQRGTEEEGLFLLGAAALCTLLMGMVALTLRTLVVRLKAHALGRTTLLCRVVGWTVRTVHDFICTLPITWKAAVGYVVFFLANVMLFTQGAYNGFWAIVWFLLHAVVLLLLCWWTVCLRKIQKGSEIIAAGNLSHQIDTAKMPHDLRSHAEALNNITGGLQNAVNEQMKSERFKAELITNVSHDLKTPLTSIINYVDLLKTTEQADPKAQEYIEVLDRKAQRLKKLTEDLVEASKASTGALSVQREKIGMGQLVSQALGEYQEKLESRHLTLVTDLPEEENFVYADGRHLWRVIDNLLGNCYKYAMEGTRVYLELTRGQGQVVLAVKNISREPLNVPPEQLMERFVRGEESRTTEGSGLGLSIARSLTELQGGTFRLEVDGDLFKAIVTMPQAG